MQKVLQRALPTNKLIKLLPRLSAFEHRQMQKWANKTRSLINRCWVTPIKKACFLKNDNINLDASYSNNFLSNLAGIASNKPVVHHSHVSGKIVSFVHDFCNQKVRENYYSIPVIAHNQFRFNFFFFMQGFRPTVWETTDIKIGAKNASNVNFAAISNQVRFIDTIKYFQRSLANLASSMNDVEKQSIRDIFARLLHDKLPFCLPDDREWILDYLAKGKGTIPYQKVTELDSLLSRPPLRQEFFDKDDFYSTLREKAVEDVKKFLNC